MKTIEQWAALKKIDKALFAAAKRKHIWAEGRNISEADFDEAIKATQHHSLKEKAAARAKARSDKKE